MPMRECACVCVRPASVGARVHPGLGSAVERATPLAHGPQPRECGASVPSSAMTRDGSVSAAADWVRSD